jgi:hypothetical protein
MTQPNQQDIEKEIKHIIEIRLNGMIEANIKGDEWIEINESYQEILEDITKNIAILISAQKEKWVKDEYKRGFNDCLRERGLTGEEYQGLYL